MAETTVRHASAAALTSTSARPTPSPSAATVPSPAVFVPPIRPSRTRPAVPPGQPVQQQRATSAQVTRPPAGVNPAPVARRRPVAQAAPASRSVRRKQQRRRRTGAGGAVGVSAAGSLLGLAVLGYLAGIGAFGEDVARYTQLGVALVIAALIWAAIRKLRS